MSGRSQLINWTGILSPEDVGKETRLDNERVTGGNGDVARLQAMYLLCFSA